MDRNEGLRIIRRAYEAKGWTVIELKYDSLMEKGPDFLIITKAHSFLLKVTVKSNAAYYRNGEYFSSGLDLDIVEVCQEIHLISGIPVVLATLIVDKQIMYIDLLDNLLPHATLKTGGSFATPCYMIPLDNYNTFIDVSEYMRPEHVLFW